MTIPEAGEFIFPATVTTTADGVTTMISQRFDFSTGFPVTNGIHLTKIAADGQILWTTNIREEYGLEPLTMPGRSTIDADGNALIYFQTMDYGTHIVKVSATGAIAWHQDLSPIVGRADFSPGIEADAAGNVYSIVYIPSHDGTFTLRFFRFAPDGQIEVNQTYTYPWFARLDDTHFTVTADGVVVGMIHVVGLESYITVQKYDLNGNFLWQYEHPFPYEVPLVEDLQSTATGDILVSYQNELWSFDRQYYALRLNSAGALIWSSWLTESSPTVFNYLFGWVPHRIPLFSGGGSFAMTSTHVVNNEVYPYGGFHTYNVNAETGTLNWETSYQFTGDSAHIGGAASSVVSGPAGHTYVIGMAATVPVDSPDYRQDFMLLDYDAAGNLVSTTTYRETNWHRMDGWLATLDGNGNLYAVCRAEELQPNGTWLFELRLLKYSLDIQPPPALSFGLTSLDFGTVPVGAAQTIALEIINAGPGPGVISQAAFSGVDPAEFSIVPPLPLVIDSAASRVLNVTWQPAVAGPLSGTLLLTHNDPALANPLPIALTGTAAGASATGPEGTLPSVFALGQNYPNPFNPATTITYDLPEARLVRLTVSNVLGQTVATLVNGLQPAGRHRATLDAAALPAGIYFYRLEAGTFTAHRKAILIK